MLQLMLRFVGQITVTLVARDHHVAQAKLRHFANQLASSYSDVLFADHRGELDEYWFLAADRDSQKNRVPYWFDWFEISGMTPAIDEQGSYLEAVDDSEAESWCLYGHLPGRGLMVIGTYPTRVQAEAIHAAINGGRYRNTEIPELTRSAAS